MQLGAAPNPSALKVVLLGAGELGKELTISLQQLGIHVTAIDHYESAPAMQVAHQSYVLNMLDDKSLIEIIGIIKPDFIVPEIEAIATHALFELETQGYTVVPSAHAVHVTMHRQRIRELAQSLELPTTPYQMVNNFEELHHAAQSLGLPCVIKPMMSSSGKGQTIVRTIEELEEAWQHSQHGGRTGGGRVIVEQFLRFDSEITLLTVCAQNKVLFCAPIGHRQNAGDYQVSWQPHAMAESTLKQAKSIAKSITQALGGHGIFGVEMFIKDNNVYFNEVSPRPHDTGLVTLCSQNLSQFALHARAFLGLPIPKIRQRGPCASRAITFEAQSNDPVIEGLAYCLAEEDTDVRLFAKPNINGKRRLGVVLGQSTSIQEAISKVENAYHTLSLENCV